MRIYSSEPLKYINNKLKIPIRNEDIDDEDVYEDMWLPVGDEKEVDVTHLIQQHRLKK